MQGNAIRAPLRQLIGYQSSAPNGRAPGGGADSRPCALPEFSGNETMQAEAIQYESSKTATTTTQLDALASVPALLLPSTPLWMH